jgi:hypothetical protein
MENEEKVMTGEESLKIITDMINRTKTNISQGSFHLIFWGWLVLICSLTQFLLLKFSSFHSPWTVWILVIPGVFVSAIYGYVKGKKEHVHTYADRIFMMTWIGFTIVAFILCLFLHDRGELIPQFILLAAGFPTFVSGFTLKFRPLIFGGIAFWILAVAAYFAGPSLGQLAVPAGMLAGYLIPGYMLRSKRNHDTV